jgi:hypothetical protein
MINLLCDGGPGPCTFLLYLVTLLLETFTYPYLGSSDTAIPISFGLISIFIGLTCLLIELLTLQAMTFETGVGTPPHLNYQIDGN